MTVTAVTVFGRKIATPIAGTDAGARQRREKSSTFRRSCP